MSASKPLIALSIALIASGCAYSSAMGRGSKMENNGDWVAAYSAYDEASAKKPDELEAQEARKRAADALVDQALREAGDAVAIGDFEIAIEKLAVASGYDADRPEVFELKSRAKVDMGERYAKLWAAEEREEAYDMAVRTRALFPESDHLDTAFSDLRKHYVSTAESQLKRKEYPEGLATLRTILEFEADRQGDIAGLEQKILQGWGTDLATRASSHTRSRRHGAAAVLYARAYEVDGRPEHLKKSRDIVGKLQPEGKLSVSLNVTGSKARTAVMREGILGSLSGIADTAVVPRRGMLDVKVAVGAQVCTEVDKITPTEKDFISGQVEEPNPEWHTLTDGLAAQRAIEEDTSAKAEALWPDVVKAEETLKGIDAELTEAKAELAVAQSAVEQAQTQLDNNKAKRDQLQQQLQAHQTSGATAMVEQTRTQLGEIGGFISDWTGQLITRTDATTAAERKVKTAETTRGPASEAVKRLKSGHDAIQKDKTAAQTEATQLSAKLGSTPKTVWKDVHEMLEYDIHDWTRTCVAPVTVTLRPEWETGRPTNEAYTPSHETADRSHIGHDKAAVKEDLKAFPDADDALVSKADTATLVAIETWLTTMAEDHFRARKTETTMALVEHPVEATTELVRLYVGAEGRLDEAAVSAFKTHVKSEFGLENLELLAGR